MGVRLCRIHDAGHVMRDNFCVLKGLKACIVSQPARSTENNDAGSATSCTETAETIRNFLASIMEIKSLYVSEEPGSVFVLAVVPEKNFAVERMVYKKQLEIVEACPGIKLTLRVISLRGRKLADIITPRGKPVFQKA